MATRRRQRFHLDATEFRANRDAVAGPILFHHAVLLFSNGTEEMRRLLNILE